MASQGRAQLVPSRSSRAAALPNGPKDTWYCLDKDRSEIVFKTVKPYYYNMCEKQFVCES